MNDLMDKVHQTMSVSVLTTAELKQLTTRQLREALAQSMTFSAQHLAYLAVIWGELEARGEDLSDLRTGLAVYLPQIAAGRLDAQAVIRFAGQPTVLRSIAGMSLDKQRALANGEPVRVLAVGADGEYTEAQIPAYALTAAQARLVFDGDKMRSGPEQQAVLETVRVRKTARARPGAKASRVQYDRDADVIRIGKVSATVGEVAAALFVPPDAPKIDDSDEEFTQLVIRSPESVNRMLKIRATEANMSVTELVNHILRTYLHI